MEDDGDVVQHHAADGTDFYRIGCAKFSKIVVTGSVRIRKGIIHWSL